MRGRTTTRPGWIRLLQNRSFWAGLLCVWLAGCASAPPPAPQALATGPADPKSLVAVLVSGDDSPPAFDNATAYLADSLAATGVPAEQIHRLNASQHRAPKAEIATQSAVLERIRGLSVPPGGSCLVYLTSHGAYEHGLYLAASDNSVMPAELDKALSAGCGKVPTVVVVSACFAGQFATAPMVRSNRIILTAADAGRTSFGCGASVRYTYFDECFLGALGEAADWHQVFDRAVSCVAQRERQIGALPSQPIASFGNDVAGLAPPATGPGTPGSIAFVPAATLFNPALIPLPTGERLRLHDELARYAAADEPKALAMSAQGLPVPVVHGHEGLRTDADVARLALERCEWLTGGACVLYARNAQTVALLPSGLAPFHPPRLVRSGPLSAVVVPFIRDDQRGEIARYLALPGPKSLALNPGRENIGIGQGATIEDARSTALAQCRTDRFDCVTFADDDRVVLGWTD